MSFTDIDNYNDNEGSILLDYIEEIALKEFYEEQR